MGRAETAEGEAGRRQDQGTPVGLCVQMGRCPKDESCSWGLMGGLASKPVPSE